MKYRKLRIAWSVACGVVSLLLVVLWVRSYSHWDDVLGKSFGNHSFRIRSLRGQLSISDLHADHQSTIRDLFLDRYAYRLLTWNRFSNLRVGDGQVSAADGNVIALVFREPKDGLLGFGTTVDSNSQGAFMPHWFPAALLLGLVGAPWIRWRFSLRTLLIGMTVAAIGLGWIVYAWR